MTKALSIFVLCFAFAVVHASAQDTASAAPTKPDAQLRLGNQYLSEKKYDLAMTWFRKAADQGNSIAQNNIGYLYESGFGVKQDYVEAMNWYRKAAAHGYATAQTNIGGLYRNGLGVKQDYVEAMNWYRIAANQGDAKAQSNLGWLYDKGLGVKQDYGEALTWYIQAADKGNTVAQNNVGWLYEAGLGVKQDYAQAMAWYYRAAAQGSAPAQNNIGKFYEKGLSGKQDYGEAMNWFRKAADQGFAKAETNIGWIYESGLGVPQDYAEAAKWYRKAAEQGDTDGQTDLGILYQDGHGVKQDYVEAMNWYRKSADQNQALAQNNIGWLYQNGFGVKQDSEEATKWYSKAAAQGYDKAKVNLESLTGNSNKGDEGTVAVVMPGGVLAPHVIFDPEPDYSEAARKSGITGEVFLTVIVGADGQTHDVKVVASLGTGLDEKAVEAVKTWKFAPATKDGKPVAVQVMVQVSFRLYGTRVGKVEVAGAPDASTWDAYLSSVIHDAEKCWTKTTDDKTHLPSIKQGEVTVQFVLDKEGRVTTTEVASSSGDQVLDRAARECVSHLKTDVVAPDGFNGKDLTVRIEMLYNMNLPGMAITPVNPRVVAGSKEQFYIEKAGSMRKTTDWSVSGVGCTNEACGTITADGLYTAPEVLPKPFYVRVKATVAGANPMTASTIIFLAEKW